MIPSDPMQGKALKPSLAIGAAFQYKLSKLINKMVKDILDTAKDLYADYDDQYLANDENPVSLAERVINRKVRYWTSVFSEAAGKTSKNFVDDVDKHSKLVVKNSLQTILPPATISKLVVKYDQKTMNVLNAKRALVSENVNLITNIPEDFGVDKITQIVLEGMQRGKDYKYVSEKLIESGNFAKKRAERIARDQLFKASGILNCERQIQLGITKNKWKHSHGDKVPRKSHLAADGKEYDITKGCYIDGEYILPGEKINCTCYSVPVIDL